jgi:hypothetical protein
MEINQKRKQVFEKTGMTYDYSEHNEQEFNFTFPVIDKFIEKNATMYLHIEFEADLGKTINKLRFEVGFFYVMD